MILYHYDISPFSEKIRLLFAHTNTPWRSFKVPPLPPRDELDVFTGGYRKIPVLQMGADFFCDTRLIADEISASCGSVSLSYSRAGEAIQSFVDRTNGPVFSAIVRDAKPTSVLLMLVKRYWPWQIVALMKDRAQMGKEAKMPRTRSSERRAMLDNWLTELEEKLSQHDYLFGDQASLADFAAYHVAWFADLTRPKKLLNPNSAAGKWQTRMQNIGHGNHTSITHKECLSLGSADPRPLKDSFNTKVESEMHEWLTRPVSIGPTDYGLERVVGKLVAADDERWVIARETDQCGIVHVHFPTVGFDMDLAE